jgi:hypothetical protein
MPQGTDAGFTRRFLMEGVAAGGLAIVGSPLIASSQLGEARGAQAPFPLIVSGIPVSVLIDNSAELRE